MAYYHLGILHRSRGNQQLAIEAYQRAIEINPQNAGAHNNLSVTYYYAEQYDLAEEHAHSAARLGRNMVSLFNQISRHRADSWAPINGTVF